MFNIYKNFFSQITTIPIYEELISVFIQNKSPFENRYIYTPNKIKRPYQGTSMKLLICSVLFIIAFSVFILYTDYSITGKIFFIVFFIFGSIKSLKIVFIKAQGIDLYNQEQYQEAINVFYQYSKITKYQAGLMLDYCFNKLNRPEDCINILQKFKPASYRIKIFYQYLVLKQYDYAIKYLNETISDTELQRHPLSASIIAMAFLYLKNDPAKAIEYIKSKKFIFTQTTSIIETGAQVWLSYNQIRAISKGKFSDMFFINEMQNSITDDSQNSYEFEINIIKYILSICYEKIGDTQSKERIEEEIRVSKIPNIANSKYFIELKNFFTDFAKANV